MRRKRKPRNVRDYILYENSVLHTLNKEQRSQLDGKKTIIIPPIYLVENVRHGVFKRSALFDFKNTVNIPHWSELVKMDLLEKKPTRGYSVLTKVPLNSIFDESDSERVKMEKQALAAANMMDAEAYKLKTLPSILHRDNDPFLELCENLDDIPDTELLRKFNQANRKSSEMDRRPYTPIVAGKNNKNISEIRRFLDEYKERSKIDTLTKAAKMVEVAFFQRLHLLELVLGFLDDMRIIPVTDAERLQIIDRHENEKAPNLDVFAPYAACAVRLFLTMAIFLMENPVNTLGKEVFRDYDYLYYVLNDNVTFVSADKAHKKFIDEIPFLNKIRQKFVYIDKQNEQTIKEGLKRIGIKG